MTLEVEDTGPGIPGRRTIQGVRPLLPCGGRAVARSRRSGLGLAIARWSVEMHGGHISAHTAEGRGSRSESNSRQPRSRPYARFRTTKPALPNVRSQNEVTCLASGLS